MFRSLKDGAVFKAYHRLTDCIPVSVVPSNFPLRTVAQKHVRMQHAEIGCKILRATYDQQQSQTNKEEPARCQIHNQLETRETVDIRDEHWQRHQHLDKSNRRSASLSKNVKKSANPFIKLKM